MQSNSGFNPDAPWLTAVGWIVDFIILNIFFVLCSLPLFTIGATVTAMHQTMHYYFITGNKDRIGRFFGVIKQRFGVSLRLWLAVAGIGAVLISDFVIVLQGEFAGQFAVLAVLFVVIITYAAVASWIFPVLARCEDEKPGWRDIVLNAWKNSISHLITTVILIIVNLCPVIIYLLLPEYFTQSTIIWLLAGFSLLFYVESLVMEVSFWPGEKEEIPSDDAL